MKKFFYLCALVFVSACNQTSAMQLNKDTFQVSASAANGYTLSQMRDVAYAKAAKAVLDAGFDKFVVLNHGSENTNVPVGFAQSSANANAYANTQNYTSNSNANSFGFFTTTQRPEVVLTVKAFKENQKEAKNAVDAQTVWDSFVKNNPMLHQGSMF